MSVLNNLVSHKVSEIRLYGKFLSVIKITDVLKHIFLSIITGIAEILFIALLGFILIKAMDKNYVGTNNIINQMLSDNIDLSDIPQLIILTAIFFLAKVVANIYLVGEEAVLLHNTEALISNRMASNLLQKPLMEVQSLNSAEIYSLVMIDSARLNNMFYSPLLIFIAEGLLVTLLIVFTFVFLDKTIMIVICSLLAVMFIVATLSRGALKNSSKTLVLTNKRHEILFHEILNSYKNIVSSGLVRVRLQAFSDSAFLKSALTAKHAKLPRYTRISIESTVYFGIIVIVFLGMLKGDRDWLSQIIPLGFVALRLMPSMLRISYSLANLVQAHEVLAKCEFALLDVRHTVRHINFKGGFSNLLELVDVAIKVPGSDKVIIEGLNLTISPGDKILIHGKSGSGKSTLLDSISGLRKIHTGRILVEGKLIDEYYSFEAVDVGCINQEARVYDETLLKNVTNLAVTVNIDLVNKLLVLVGLDDVVNSLGVDRLSIGDNGNKLSGGQRQKLLLARSLYFSPKILIIDEALNGLDVKSESVILARITKEYPYMAILFVTHRDINFVFNKKVLLGN
jgi:ABC-type bacteriocin/lantibiotic exporter with double-glycine peptidase domain